MIVDKVWKLTNTSRVGLDARSSHTHRRSTFPDNVCSNCPPCHGVSYYENLTIFKVLFFEKKFRSLQKDMEDIWVTNLSEDRKRFYLVSSLLDPHTKMFSFYDNKYFPSYWKDDVLGYLSMDLKSFYIQSTQGEVKDLDGQVKHRSD